MPRGVPKVKKNVLLPEIIDEGNKDDLGTTQAIVRNNGVILYHTNFLLDDDKKAYILYECLIKERQQRDLAEELGCSQATISNVIVTATNSDKIQTLVKRQFDKRIISKAMKKTEETLDNLVPANIPDAKKFMTIGTLIDKIQLLSDQPTEIIQHSGLDQPKILQIFQQFNNNKQDKD